MNRIVLTPNSCFAEFGRNKARLTRLELALLTYLMSNPDRICLRDEIIDAVWGTRFRYDTGTINVHLSAIRRKLSLPNNYPIETIRGVGLCYHADNQSSSYAFNLREVVVDWLQHHESELQKAGLVPQLALDPFVSEIGQSPDTFRKMMDSILDMLLPTASPGFIRISTKLTISHFVFTIDINGTINSLQIPVICR